MSGKNPRELLEEFQKGFMEFNKTQKEEASAFANLLSTYDRAGALSEKHKELISVAIGLTIRCEYCVVVHVYHAYKAGATKEEIMEAGLVAITMGGGPVMTYYVTLLKDCANEFENDFK